MSIQVQSPATPEKTPKVKKSTVNGEEKKSKKRKQPETEDQQESQEHESASRSEKKPKKRRTSDIRRSEEATVVRDSQDSDSSGPSPFVEQTSTLYLPLSPAAQETALEALCAEHLSPLILTYYAPFKGVLLGYSNPRISNGPHSGSKDDYVVSKSIGEYAVTYTWLTADFLIFQPKIGTQLEGYVNIQNESHVGLICYNLFNASIESQRLPKEWSWQGPNQDITAKQRKTMLSQKGQDKTTTEQEPDEEEEEEDHGTFVNGDGAPIDGLIRFTVKDIDSLAALDKNNRGFLSIEGTLLSREDDKDLDLHLAKKREAQKKSRKQAKTNAKVTFSSKGDF